MLLFLFPPPPLCPDRGVVAQSTETSVTSGEQPAAILGTNVATNTFQTRKARTGNRGSLELVQLSAPAVRREAVSAERVPGAFTY